MGSLKDQLLAKGLAPKPTAPGPATPPTVKPAPTDPGASRREREQEVNAAAHAATSPKYLGGRIATLSLRDRIPMISTAPEITAVGGLVSYGVSRQENYRRSAYFIRKILDGTKPADLPVEQPTTILLSINLKTAQALGLTIPPSMLATANEVIE